MRYRVHLVLNVLDAALTITKTFEDVNVFNSVFTPLILSHFFLGIRGIHYTNNQVSTPSQISSLRFGRIQPVEGRAIMTGGLRSDSDSVFTEDMDAYEDEGIITTCIRGSSRNVRGKEA
ncbi:hypothetical protein DAEQUDRAFT_724175 [Daedalea quercina L-15889]|uniref:Uncharacterized protein n=1 Tax=Daedalea quercina L-15889 TaxID=1314783 RepID=A0A165RWH6_9APHY|nr:hypothetical protein DAEQUDRAFT_724175 [Daedalea quercina L-15889]